MKRLLSENTRVLEQESFSIKNNLIALNQLRQFFEDNSLGQLTHDRLYESVLNGEKLIRNIIMQKIPDRDQHTGLKLNKEKILSEIQELPHMDFDLLHLINVNVIGKQYLSLYDFEANMVTLNEERLRAHLDRHRFYSDDPQVLKAFDALNSIAQQLNQLNEKLEFMPLNQFSGGSSEFFFKSLTELFTISPSGLKLQAEAFRNAMQIFKSKRT